MLDEYLKKLYFWVSELFMLKEKKFAIDMSDT